MNIFDGVELRDWVGALAVIAAMVVLKGVARASLKELRSDGNWSYLSRLAPSLSNLIYVVGLHVFVEVAPLTPKAALWCEDGAYVLTVIIILGLIRRSCLMGIEWGGLGRNKSQALQQGFIPLLRNIITLFVFLAGAIMVLKHFNYDVMSLVTALGVGSLAVGLAAKDTLSNMISGFTLIIDRNLRPGDRVNLGGAVGDVEEIGLRSTRIRTGDGNTLIVPNSDLVNTKILNLSVPSREGTASTTLRLPYEVPFSKVKPLCETAIREVAKAHYQRGAWVLLASVAEGYQTVNIGFWVHDMDDAGGAISDFHEKLLSHLQSAGISLFEPVVSMPVTSSKS